MKEIVVTSMEAGQRMDKLLGRYLKEAPKSFLYKMLRKKNITLNGKKADGFGCRKQLVRYCAVLRQSDKPISLCEKCRFISVTIIP